MSGLGVAVLGAAAFSAIAAVNRIIGRSWLYPPAAMTGIWTIVFIALCFASRWLYALPFSALEIFLVGACFVSIGSYMGLNIKIKTLPFDYGNRRGYKSYRSDFWLLIVLFILALVGLPLYLHHLEKFASAPLFTPQFFFEVRSGLLLEEATLSRAPLVENLVVVSSILCLVGFAVADSTRRWRALLAALVVLALIYNSLTSSKVGLVSLIVEVAAIYFIRRDHFPWRIALATLAALLVGFGVITILREELVTGNALSVKEAVYSTWNTFSDYLVVSVVAFGVYLQNPLSVPAVWSIWRPFERLFNYFGHYFYVPDINASYVEVGHGLSYNTYTAYFAYYPQYGVLGVALIMFFLGILSTLLYRKAKGGGLISTLFFATLIYGLCMTFFNESLFMRMNFIAKVIIFGGVFVLFRRVWGLFEYGKLRKFDNSEIGMNNNMGNFKS